MERLQNIFLILILVLRIHVFYSFLVLFFAPDIETICNKIENKTKNTRKILIICFISHTHPPPIHMPFIKWRDDDDTDDDVGEEEECQPASKSSSNNSESDLVISIAFEYWKIRELGAH